jgi:hypothetical protein
VATFDDRALDVRCEGREPECFPDPAAVEVGLLRQIVDALYGSLLDGLAPAMGAHECQGERAVTACGLTGPVLLRPVLDAACATVVSQFARDRDLGAGRQGADSRAGSAGCRFIQWGMPCFELNDCVIDSDHDPLNLRADQR